MTVVSPQVVLGGPLEIRWRFTGSTRAVRQLRIGLEGIEKATYRRGTTTTTDTEKFATIPIIETTDPQTIAAGGATITIPADTMHTFSSGRNEIEWSLTLAGVISFWPDVEERFELVIMPPPLLE
jgi:hypothetical protein